MRPDLKEVKRIAKPEIAVSKRVSYTLELDHAAARQLAHICQDQAAHLQQILDEGAAPGPVLENRKDLAQRIHALLDQHTVS